MLNSTVSPTYDLQGRSNSPKLSKSQYKGKSHNLWKSLSCAARILTQPFAIQEFEMYKYINSVLIFFSQNAQFLMQHSMNIAAT